MDKNCEGLVYLTWDLFDSPDQPGSGYKFMEREPVLILDNAIHMMQRKMFTKVVMGYASPYWANRCKLSINDSHRIGKAITLKCPDAAKKHDLVKALLSLGVERIALQKNGKEELVYFDTDTQKKRGIFTWILKEYEYGH